MPLPAAVLPVRCPRPLIGYAVSAGFPNPAEDFLERDLDLTAHCIRNQAATFFWRVSGDSMIRAGIHDGALLIVDRSLTAVDGSIIVASLAGGEFVCKRLRVHAGRACLESENDAYPTLVPDEFQVWGVATFVVRSLRGRR